MYNNKYDKNKKWLLFILILLSLGINVYFRLNTLFLPHFDKIAKVEVYNDLKDELYKEISSSYPEISENKKNELLNTLFNLELKQGKSDIKNKIIQKSRQLKAYYQDERGWTYLLEGDPYRWFRRVENFLNTGYFGTSRINNQDYDNLMSAPFGSKIEPLKLHFYIGVYFYKLLHFINNKLTLMNCLGLLPVFLSAIMVLTIFGISILLGISYLSSFIVSLVIGLSPVILVRSTFGWFDTDIYNVFLPLLIISTMSYSFKEKKLKYWIFLSLSGLLIGFYSAIWSIWWFILYLSLVSLFLYNLNIITYDRQNSLSIKLKKSFLSISIFIIATYLAVLFISGPEAIKKSFQEPFYYFSLRQGLTLDNFWPNVVFTVGELKPSSFQDLVNWTGNHFILYGGVLGLLLLIIFKRSLLDFKEKSFLSLVLLIWLLVMLYLSNLGTRFIIFLVVPIGISFGAFLDMLNNFMSEKQNKIYLLRNVNKKLYNLMLSGIIIMVAIMPLSKATMLEAWPEVNDSWWNTLIKIKESTPQDAIIDTYWDPGDWIMSIAKRATLFDAHWQYTSIPYWMARVLISQDEEEAVGILRMLNSGANNAFEELSRKLDDDKLTSFELINKMILLKKDESSILLNKYIKDKNAIDKILKHIYGPPRSSYLLVYDKFINVMPILSRIANWDFQRLVLWQKFSKLNKDSFIDYCKDRFGYQNEYSETIYNTLKLMNKKDIFDWISKEMYQFYTPYSEGKISQTGERLILFDNGLVVDKEGLNCYFRDDIYAKWLTPAHLISITKDTIKENINKEGDGSYSVLFSEENNIYKAMLFSKPLAKSLFVRLYFMNGSGLKHFKLIHHEQKDRINIYLYEIVWSNKKEEQ